MYRDAYNAKMKFTSSTTGIRGVWSGDSMREILRGVVNFMLEWRKDRYQNASGKRGFILVTENR
jgi:hypothetical protein